MFPDAVVETRSLVRLNPDEVNDIRAGLRVGLEDIYGSDNYVYYVDYYGNPQVWTGFSGYAMNTDGSPYISCPLHNQETLQNYQPTNPGFGFEDGSGNIVYPDNGDLGIDFGNGGTITDDSSNQYYGDYSGNGDVFF